MPADGADTPTMIDTERRNFFDEHGYLVLPGRLQPVLPSLETAFREVEDALISTQKVGEELASQSRQVQALLDYARLARKRYDNGFVSYIEVLDSERQLFDAELVNVQIQAGLHASLISLYKAMGGGWVMKAEEMADLGGSSAGDDALP